MSASFVCRSCGSGDLAIVHEYAMVVHYAARAGCICGRCLHEIAALRTFHVTVVSQEWGQLGADGGWQAENQEDIAWLGATEDDFTLLCPACVEASQDDRWDLAETRREFDPRAEFYYVRCRHCDGDIELRAAPLHERAVGLRMAS